MSNRAGQANKGKHIQIQPKRESSPHTTTGRGEDVVGSLPLAFICLDTCKCNWSHTSYSLALESNHANDFIFVNHKQVSMWNGPSLFKPWKLHQLSWRKFRQNLAFSYLACIQHELSVYSALLWKSMLRTKRKRRSSIHTHTLELGLICLTTQQDAGKQTLTPRRCCLNLAFLL